MNSNRGLACAQAPSRPSSARSSARSRGLRSPGSSRKGSTSATTDLQSSEATRSRTTFLQLSSSTIGPVQRVCASALRRSTKFGAGRSGRVRHQARSKRSRPLSLRSGPAPYRARPPRPRSRPAPDRACPTRPGRRVRDRVPASPGRRRGPRRTGPARKETAGRPPGSASASSVLPANRSSMTGSSWPDESRSSARNRRWIGPEVRWRRSSRAFSGSAT